MITIQAIIGFKNGQFIFSKETLIFSNEKLAEKYIQKFFYYGYKNVEDKKIFILGKSFPIEIIEDILKDTDGIRLSSFFTKEDNFIPMPLRPSKPYRKEIIAQWTKIENNVRERIKEALDQARVYACPGVFTTKAGIIPAFPELNLIEI